MGLTTCIQVQVLSVFVLTGVEPCLCHEIQLLKVIDAYCARYLKTSISDPLLLVFMDSTSIYFSYIPSWGHDTCVSFLDFAFQLIEKQKASTE